MRVRVRGTIYQSVREVAEAFGMTRDGVYGAIYRGKADLIGLGKTSPKKTVIGGVEFRSISAASKALGFDRRFLQDVNRDGGPKRKARLEAAVVAYLERMKQS